MGLYLFATDFESWISIPGSIDRVKGGSRQDCYCDGDCDYDYDDDCNCDYDYENCASFILGFFFLQILLLVAKFSFCGPLPIHYQLRKLGVRTRLHRPDQSLTRHSYIFVGSSINCLVAPCNQWIMCYQHAYIT